MQAYASPHLRQTPEPDHWILAIKQKREDQGIKGHKRRRSVSKKDQFLALSGRNFYGRKTERAENGLRVVECKGNLLKMTGISMINL